MRPRSRDQQQKLADDVRLLRAWRKWHKEELEQALAGPHGSMIERLVFMLKALEFASAPLLIAYIRGVDWATVDYSTRLTALHEINTAITRMRERRGLAPFDDPIPPRDDSVFRRVKARLLDSRNGGSARPKAQSASVKQ
jgi:hypothetical protein